MKYRRFFPEYSDMQRYCVENNIRDFTYNFTFAYGYELIVKEVRA